MADMGGKSYKDTAPLGAAVDLSGEKELEAIRTMKQEGSLDASSGDATLRSQLSEGAAQVTDELRERAGELYDDALRRAGGLYDEAVERAGAVASDAADEARSRFDRLVEERPVQLLLGVGLMGYFLGRFG
jgi:uncharacterized protein YjbJ (UPF0337 family)